MSDLQARVEAMRQQSSVQAEAKRAAVRAAMPDDMAAFVDAWKAIDPEMKLNHLATASLVIGKEGERGMDLRIIQIGPPAISARPSCSKKGER